MAKLIEVLKKEHTVIAEALDKVRGQGLTSKEGQNSLLAAKKGLLGHLKKEDLLLYPVLNKAAESDASLKRTLETFAKDMEGISRAALEFFEKYSDGGLGLEFGRDFGKFYALLCQRISKEENIIFEKYDELNQHLDINIFA